MNRGELGALELERIRARDRAIKAAMPIEQKRAYNAKWRATVSEEWREAKRAYNRERYRRLVEADPARGSRYRAQNAERVREWDRARYERDKPKRIALANKHASIRRVRISGGGTYRITERDWSRLVARFDGRCAYCGMKPVRLERDHVIPVAKGGRHSIGNLLPACLLCNHSKGARYLVEWRARQNTAPAVPATPANG